MGYELCAVIGNEELLRELDPEWPVVPLAQGLALVPLEDTGDGAAVGRFYNLTEELSGRLAVASHNGAVAYVEADFFGGAGTQSVVVWRNGDIVLGPLHTQTHEEIEGYVTTSDMAINHALRTLGATNSDSRDEFDSLGLGRFRQTGDWARTEMRRPD